MGKSSRIISTASYLPCCAWHQRRLEAKLESMKIGVALLMAT